MIDDKSLETLKLIQKHRVKGEFLTYQEMGDRLGITKSSAKARVVKLEAMVLVKTEPHKARKVALTNEGIEAIAYSLLSPMHQRFFKQAIDKNKKAWWLDALDKARHGRWEDDDA